MINLITSYFIDSQSWEDTEPDHESWNIDYFDISGVRSNIDSQNLSMLGNHT